MSVLCRRCREHASLLLNQSVGVGQAPPVDRQDDAQQSVAPNGCHLLSAILMPVFGQNALDAVRQRTRPSHICIGTGSLETTGQSTCPPGTPAVSLPP